VESAEGAGSVFHFVLHLREATGPGAPAGRVPELEGRRVLLVDDSAVNRKILRLQVERLGMTVVEAASGADALTLLRHEAPFDLALVDHYMAEMDGVMLAREVRELSERVRPPLIFLPSVSMNERLGAATRELFRGVVPKPIHFAQLFDTICQVFSADAPQARPAPARPAPERPLGEVHPLRILLAEDHPVNQKVALKLLKQMGYRADVASNGLEVLEALGRQNYDLVLMDVQMPQMDGLEAARRIRATIVPAVQPRIIAMTANAMEGDREKCLEAGMDEYLSKPIRPAALKDALTQVRPLAQS
jgi:CheY-like chemotaxis protein